MSDPCPEPSSAGSGASRSTSPRLRPKRSELTTEAGSSGVVVLEPAWTIGDPDLLERLAANLVSNAIRHNIVGGRIEVTTRAESRCVHLTVANTGPLVPAAELARLFQPFQRFKLKSSGDGVGLGLAIVQAIADAHDATVTAEARPGGGLGIDVALPALD